MDVVRPEQFFTLFVFLGLLGLLWYFVKANRDGLGAKIRQGKRIAITDAIALSPTDRAMIVAVDGQEFFIIKSKGVAPVVTPLAKQGETA